jgi:hypothetical protein
MEGLKSKSEGRPFDFKALYFFLSLASNTSKES